jgi:glycosyltransferase involved in cell wall biosynthesis
MNVTAVVSCVVESDVPFVKAALLSIKQQTHPCHVIVVVTENTCNVRTEISSIGIDAQIETTHLSPCGITKNFGVQRASTEWIAFLDADDVWFPRKIELQLAHASKHSCAAVGARHILVDGDAGPFFYAFARNMPMPSSWLVKRDLLLQEPFSDRTQYDDAELWARFNRRTPTRTLREYLIYYRVSPGSHSSSYSPPKMRKQWFARAARNPILRRAFLALSRGAGTLYLPVQNAHSRV